MNAPFRNPPGFMRGMAAIGLARPKRPENVGSVARAAMCYGVKFLAVEHPRCDVKVATDTTGFWKHYPILRTDDLKASIPYGVTPVAIDLIDDAEPLTDFKHPERAFYVFGPEDGTLGERHLSFCPRRVMIPTRQCMNLAATVNVVLYDRMAKRREWLSASVAA